RAQFDMTISPFNRFAPHSQEGCACLRTLLSSLLCRIPFCSTDQARSSPLAQEQLLEIGIGPDHDVTAELARNLVAQAIAPIRKLLLVVTKHGLVDQKLDFVSALGVDQACSAAGKTLRFELFRRCDVDGGDLLLERTQSFQAELRIV